MRRVRHRMSQIGVEDYGGYIDQPQVNADEFSVLFNTILINVTAFFRAPEAWEYLRHEAIPVLLAERAPDYPVRVWSAGCASGEEAYSLNQETRSRILGRFHFALVPKGVLFHGKAEMLLSHSRIFDPIDLKRRLFRKTATGPHPSANFVSHAMVHDRRVDLRGVDEPREHAFSASPVAQIVVTQLSAGQRRRAGRCDPGDGAAGGLAGRVLAAQEEAGETGEFERPQHDERALGEDQVDPAAVALGPDGEQHRHAGGTDVVDAGHLDHQNGVRVVELVEQEGLELRCRREVDLPGHAHHRRHTPVVDGEVQWLRNIHGLMFPQLGGHRFVIGLPGGGGPDLAGLPLTPRRG